MNLQQLMSACPNLMVISVGDKPAPPRQTPTITNRRTLKRLRGVFRKWIKAGRMVRRETYSRTSRAPGEISLPEIPPEIGELALSSREIDAIGAGRADDKVRVSEATERALERYRARVKRRAVLANAMAQAEALNR
jgi:hypothetical protein